MMKKSSLNHIKKSRNSQRFFHSLKRLIINLYFKSLVIFIIFNNPLSKKVILLWYKSSKQI